MSNTKEFRCLFCTSKISMSWVSGIYPPYIINCSKCGSLCVLSTKEYKPFYINRDPFLLTLSEEKYQTLEREQKIRTQVLEYNEDKQPICYLTQVFPITNQELVSFFTKRQIEVLQKNLSSELLSETERSILSKIRKKITCLRQKYNIIQNLFLYEQSKRDEIIK